MSDAAPTAPRHTKVTRWAALFGALVVLAVGLGLGPRHWRVEGLGAATVVGFLLILGGLVGLVWTTVRVLASSRRRWWPLQVLVVLVSTYLVAWTLGQAVAATYPPRPSLGDTTPSEVGMEARDVRFPSQDGVDLDGWYVPSRTGAAVLARHGYGILLFDARGHGESDGRGMDFGWYGDLDARGAVDFVVQQPDVDPGRVGLLGLSMGGEQAIGAAGSDDRVAAVVAEGATARVAADKEYLDAYGTRGKVQQRIDAVTFGLTDLLSSAPRPAPLRSSVLAATSRSAPAAFLLVTAGEEPDEGYAAARLRSAAPSAVSTWTVPTAHHVEGLRTAPEEWEARVVDFFDQTLVR